MFPEPEEGSVNVSSRAESPSVLYPQRLVPL